jgi:hypothetical protein
VTQDPNLAKIELIASALGPLRDQLVFVGGCAVGLLITDSGWNVSMHVRSRKRLLIHNVLIQSGGWRKRRGPRERINITTKCAVMMIDRCDWDIWKPHPTRGAWSSVGRKTFLSLHGPFMTEKPTSKSRFTLSAGQKRHRKAEPEIESKKLLTHFGPNGTWGSKGAFILPSAPQ